MYWSELTKENVSKKFDLRNVINLVDNLKDSWNTVYDLEYAPGYHVLSKQSFYSGDDNLLNIREIYQNKTDLVTHTVHSNPQDFPKYNDFPISLEEEMVEKMAPLVKYPSTSQSSYKAALNKIHDAADINYTGVI